MSKQFDIDLTEEQKLGVYLDNNFYNDIKQFPVNFSVKRITGMKGQFAGIDIEITDLNNNQKYYIDEKGQSHYKNKNMPTFAFEISFLNKQKQWRPGWLFSSNKITQQYILCTCIQEINDVIIGSRILLVDRQKLLDFLISKKLDKQKCEMYEKDFRTNDKVNKQPISELSNREGYFFYSKHIEEEPINLVLYIQTLINNKIAKELVSCPL